MESIGTVIFATLLFHVATGQLVVIDNVRLSDGNDTAGRVEVEVNGVWGTVCDDGWDELDARVVCRSLGLSGGIPFNRASFGSGSGPIHMDDVNCQGNENSLGLCGFSTGSIVNCEHNEDASVVCQPSGAQPLPTQPPTTLRPAVTLSDACVNNGGSNQQGVVRLLGIEDQPGVGYVQARAPNGTYGFVCDDGWDVNAAKVVCRELCFSTSETEPGLKRTFSVNVTNPVFALDDVNCVGTEASVQDCSHRDWFQHNCGESELAAVTCVSAVYPTPPPPNPDLQCREGDLIALFNKTRDKYLEAKHLSVANVPQACPEFNVDDTAPDVITARIPFESCGTKVVQNETHIIYSNVIHMASTYQVNGISRSNEFRVELVCEMPRDATVDKGVQPLTQTVTQRTEGNFVINMTIYEDQLFTQAASVYPYELNLGDWLNAAVELQSIDSRLKLVVTNCIAKANTTDPNTPTRSLLVDKCVEEGTTMEVYPLNQVKVGLRFQSFVFVSYPTVVLQCDAIVCLKTEETSECDRSCNNSKPATASNSAGRRRRHALGTSDVINGKHVYKIRSRPVSIVNKPSTYFSGVPRTTTPRLTTSAPADSTTPKTAKTSRLTVSSSSVTSRSSTTKSASPTVISVRATAAPATTVSPAAHNTEVPEQQESSPLQKQDRVVLGGSASLSTLSVFTVLLSLLAVPSSVFLLSTC